jgi:hypothetical protein
VAPFTCVRNFGTERERLFSISAVSVSGSSRSSTTPGEQCDQMWEIFFSKIRRFSSEQALDLIYFLLK